MLDKITAGLNIILFGVIVLKESLHITFFGVIGLILVIVFSYILGRIEGKK